MEDEISEKERREMSVVFIIHSAALHDYSF